MTPTELGFHLLRLRLSLRRDADRRRLGPDRFGPRRVLAILSLLWAAATMLTGLAWSVASLVWFRLLVGVGEGGAFPTATRALTCWLPVRERGVRAGHHPQLRAARRRGHAAHRPRHRARDMDGAKRSMSSARRASRGRRSGSCRSGTRRSEHPWVTGAELAVIRAGGGARRGARGPTPWRQIASRMWLVTLVDFCYGWSLWVFLTWLPSYLSDARGFKLRADGGDDDAAVARRRGRRHARRSDLGRDFPPHREPPAGAARAAGRRPRRRVRVLLPAIVTGSARRRRLICWPRRSSFSS